MAFNTFTVLYNHRLCLVIEHFHHSKGNLPPRPACLHSSDLSVCLRSLPATVVLLSPSLACFLGCLLCIDHVLPCLGLQRQWIFLGWVGLGREEMVGCLLSQHVKQNLIMVKIVPGNPVNCSSSVACMTLGKQLCSVICRHFKLRICELG